MNATTLQLSPEMEALKTKLKSTWVSGDFGKIAQSFVDGAAEFVKRQNLQPETEVLDVACGSGNQSIPAAQAGANVTGIDIAPNLIEQAKEWAIAEGLVVKFEEGDAENLPYSDASFDTVISMFGAMFAPRPDLVSAEMLRVSRPGGKIVMANWTPTGFIGQMFKLVGSYVKPPANMPSPLLWGDENTVRERLVDGVSEIEFNRHLITFTFPFDIKETIECWKDYYGPTHKAFLALDEVEQAALREDLEQLWSYSNLATNGTTQVNSEYLEVVAIRK